MSNTSNKKLGGVPSQANGPETDWIHLRRLELHCVLGVYQEERHRERPIWLDIALACDTRRAGESDQLADTLNYELIEEAAIAVAKKGKFRLIESLAAGVANACLAHAGVQAVRVTVDKPGALAHTRSVAVEIVRYN